MTNRFLISVATAALMASVGAANAQGTGGAPGSMGGSPSAGSAAPAERGSAAPSERGAAPQMNKSDAPGAGMKASQTDDKSAPGGAKTQRAQDGSPKGSMGADNDKAGKDMKAGDRDMDRKAGNDRDQMNKNADKDRDPANRNAGNDRDRERTTTGQAGAGGKLSSEQRTKITTVIKSQNIHPQTNINFSISVGTRVPRDVRFHPLPAEILTVYPDWRGYEFFLVRDEIIVVDPRTLEIVAVLDA
jgi:hypothetical protein